MCRLFVILLYTLELMIACYHLIVLRLHSCYLLWIYFLICDKNEQLSTVIGLPSTSCCHFQGQINNLFLVLMKITCFTTILVVI